MEKRGQVTVFIILGIIIVAIIVLIGFLRTKIYIGPVTAEGISLELEPIKKHVEKCLSDVSDDPIKKIALQGGYLNPGEGTYRLFNDIRISYLCFDIADQPNCMNRMLTKLEMQQQLEQEVKDKLATCINLEAYKKLNYEIIYNNINTAVIKVDIGDDTTTITMDYLIKLQKGDIQAEIKDFSVKKEYPLGRLYNVARDIIEAEATAGEPDQALYMLYYGQVFNKLLFINKQEYPYPDRRYELRIDKNDNPFLFEFYVQGAEGAV